MNYRLILVLALSFAVRVFADDPALPEDIRKDKIQDKILLAHPTTNPCSSIENSTAVFAKGTQEFQGCQLQQVAPGSIYADLGLKKGDIVHPHPTSNKMEIKNTLKSSAQQKAAPQD
jgi:hypothetical protein